MNKINSLVKILWDYNHLNHPLKKSDCILALGSYDTLVAERAVDLFFQGYAPYIVFSGAFGKWTKDNFNKPEAEVFADIAREKGVPEDKIIIENKSTNTGENIIFTKALLKEKGIDFNSFILVQKPYMERRAYATFKKIWLEKNVVVTSPQVNFEEYIKNAPRSEEQVINSIVADTNKIKLYAEKGYQIPQEMHEEVQKALQTLILLGFDKNII